MQYIITRFCDWTNVNWVCQPMVFVVTNDTIFVLLFLFLFFKFKSSIRYEWVSLWVHLIDLRSIECDRWLHANLQSVWPLNWWNNRSQHIHWVLNFSLKFAQWFFHDDQYRSSIALLHPIARVNVPVYLPTFSMTSARKKTT